MEVQRPQARASDEVVPQDVTVSHYQREVGAQSGQRLTNLFGESLGLEHGQPARQRPLFDGIGLHLLAATGRSIRLGEHTDQLDRGLRAEEIQQRPRDGVGAGVGLGAGATTSGAASTGAGAGVGSGVAASASPGLPIMRRRFTSTTTLLVRPWLKVCLTSPASTERLRPRGLRMRWLSLSSLIIARQSFTYSSIVVGPACGRPTWPEVSRPVALVSIARSLPV